MELTKDTDQDLFVIDKAGDGRIRALRSNSSRSSIVVESSLNSKTLVARSSTIERKGVGGEAKGEDEGKDREGKEEGEVEEEGDERGEGGDEGGHERQEGEEGEVEAEELEAEREEGKCFEVDMDVENDDHSFLEVEDSIIFISSSNTTSSQAIWKDSIHWHKGCFLYFFLSFFSFALFTLFF